MPETPAAADCVSTMSSATSACLMYRLGWLSSTSRIFRRYCCLSHCARGDHTAGPRDVFSKRNWIPTASVTSPMMPPSASTSRTKWPLAMPPTAGLHDICAIRSTLSVYSAVFSPMRAQATAASQPACPAPTTTTSKCSVNCIGGDSTRELPYILASRSTTTAGFEEYTRRWTNRRAGRETSLLNQRGFYGLETTPVTHRNARGHVESSSARWSPKNVSENNFSRRRTRQEVFHLDFPDHFKNAAIDL